MYERCRSIWQGVVCVSKCQGYSNTTRCKLQQSFYTVWVQIVCICVCCVCVCVEWRVSLSCSLSLSHSFTLLENYNRWRVYLVYEAATRIPSPTTLLHSSSCSIHPHSHPPIPTLKSWQKAYVGFVSLALALSLSQSVRLSESLRLFQSPARPSVATLRGQPLFQAYTNT